MKRKLVNGHERALLLRRFMDRQISDETCHKISHTFIGKTQKDRETHAHNINEIIDNSKTEQEILDKINNMSVVYGPLLTDETVYIDDKYQIRKIWQWDAKGATIDPYSDVLKVMLETYDEGESVKYTFVSLDGKRLTDTEFDTDIDTFYMDCSHDGIFFVSKGDQYAFLDTNMNLVTPFKYDEVADFCEGITVAKSDRQWLCVDTNGTEKPFDDCQYTYYAFCYKEDMCLVCSDDKQLVKHLYPDNYTREQQAYGFVDKNGHMAIPPTYIRATDYYGGIAFVAVYKKENGIFINDDLSRGALNVCIWGGIDKSGKEVIPFIFDRIECFYGREDIFMAHYGGWENGNWGVIDRNGNWLIAPVYREFGHWTYGSLIPFLENDLYGVYDYKQHKVILTPQYSNVYFLDNDDIKVRVFDENLNYVVEKIIDINGKERFHSKYTHIYEKDGYLSCEIYSDGCKSMEFVSYDGTVILPMVNDVWWHFKYNGKDYFTFNEKEAHLEGVKDRNGNIVIPAIYKSIHRDDVPYIVAETADGRQQLITINNEVVFPPIYNSLFWCSDQHLMAVDDDGCEMYLVKKI